MRSRSSARCRGEVVEGLLGRTDGPASWYASAQACCSAAAGRTLCVHPRGKSCQRPAVVAVHDFVMHPVAVAAHQVQAKPAGLPLVQIVGQIWLGRVPRVERRAGVEKASRSTSPYGSAGSAPSAVA